MALPEHHVLYYKNYWRANKDAKDIREDFWLRIPLDSLAHTALHKQVSFVPVPDRHTIQRVLKDFTPVRHDYVATVQDLIGCFDRATKHPNTQPLERSIAELTMRAIELQLPYIEDGLSL